MSRSIANEVNHYAGAGGIAEESLTSLRTVYAFNGQSHECERYDAALEKAKINGIYRSIYIGVAYGATQLIMFCSYCLAFWIGTNFVVDKSMDAQTLITVFFSIMMGSTALGQAGQQFAVIGTAQGAAAATFEIIDKYCPAKLWLLVGSSGCGKSTIISLLLRFYDPSSGDIKLDGNDISGLNLKTLRKFIGVVSQEPTLFDCSIEENIKFGNSDISDDEMWEASKIANANKFISNLPMGYKTTVGERGVQLSGGQKQRIAIARALIRNPKILLLDEATSALDAESEFSVQEALDRARQGRTTIIIAHRLSTIRNADKIIAIKNGKVIETGSHTELISKKGYYHKLVNSQVFVDIDCEFK
uniref:ABC-type xenobiotic transporter n=1 Tax=Panagrolaimus superbus TaxID=310955 RepID=A0A914Z2K9_9BILA